MGVARGHSKAPQIVRHWGMAAGPWAPCHPRPENTHNYPTGKECYLLSGQLASLAASRLTEIGCVPVASASGAGLCETGFWGLRHSSWVVGGHITAAQGCCECGAGGSSCPLYPPPSALKYPRFPVFRGVVIGREDDRSRPLPVPGSFTTKRGTHDPSVRRRHRSWHHL